MPLQPQKCMVRHPSQPWFCTLLVQPGEETHEGPHGWDYEKGERAFTTAAEIDAKLRAKGLGHVADHLAFLDERR